LEVSADISLGGGDFDQLQVAWMAAAAYAKATGGVVFDDQEAKVRTAAEAREVVQEIERGMPAVEAMLRDLKRP
jgi:myosin-crossreactive antigen